MIDFTFPPDVDEVRLRVAQVEPLDSDAGAGAEMVSIYVPTTPTPTSGFFLMMRRDDTMELDMSVDEALKYIVSMGVVAPPMRNPSGRAQNQ